MITSSVLAVMKYAGVQGDLEAVSRMANELDVLTLARHLRALPPTIPAYALQMAQGRASQDVAEVLAPLQFSILKGAPLGAQLFGNTILRTTTDVDILVHPNDVDEAQRHLTTARYRCRHEAIRRRLDNQQPWEHPTLPIIIELHWSVALPTLPQPPVELFLGYGQEGLPPIPLLFQLVLHFHNHGGFLKGLIDLAAWHDLYANSVDWDEIHQIASDHAMLGLISWPLGVIQEICDEPILRKPALPIVSAWTGWTLESLKNILEQNPSDVVFTGINAPSQPWQNLTRQALLCGLFDGSSARLKALLEPALHRVLAWNSATDMRSA